MSGGHEGPRRRPAIGKIGRGTPTARCAQPPAAALVHGIAEFNAGLFFEQHETLEEAWIEEHDPIRYLYQGILQIGVGFYHLLTKRNAYGAGRMWAKGVRLLETFPPVCSGVEVAALVAATHACMAELERVTPDLDAFDRRLIPQIHMVNVA